VWFVCGAKPNLKFGRLVRELKENFKIWARVKRKC